METRDIRRGSGQIYHDERRQCLDCGCWYVWEAGEQEFYNGKVPPLMPPKRCPECRARRRATIQQPIPVAESVGQRPDRFDPTGRWQDLYPTRYGGGHD